MYEFYVFVKSLFLDLSSFFRPLSFMNLFWSGNYTVEKFCFFSLGVCALILSILLILETELIFELWL